MSPRREANVKIKIAMLMAEAELLYQVKAAEFYSLSQKDKEYDDPPLLTYATNFNPDVWSKFSI